MLIDKSIRYRQCRNPASLFLYNLQAPSFPRRLMSRSFSHRKRSFCGSLSLSIQMFCQIWRVLSNAVLLRSSPHTSYANILVLFRRVIELPRLTQKYFRRVDRSTYFPHRLLSPANQRHPAYRQLNNSRRKPGRARPRKLSRPRIIPNNR